MLQTSLKFLICAKINTEVHSILECTYFTKDSRGSSIRANGGIVRIRIGQGPMGLQGPMLLQGPTGIQKPILNSGTQRASGGPLGFKGH